ncbi:MAG: HAMP domain-containing sensor histidine kinase [Planctomycetota bacterium]
MGESSFSSPIRQPLVTTRIGMFYFVVALCALVFGLLAISLPKLPGLQSMMWVATVAVCSLSGLISMRSVRTLRIIETELQRNAGESSRWQTVRPILGDDTITRAWNELLAEAEKSRPLHAPVEATLDEDSLVLSRAMPSLPVAWVITDVDGRMLQINPAACNLFSLPEDANHVGRDLMDLLGLRAGGDSVASKRGRLLSNVRMIHERHHITISGERLYLRIARSRLDSRNGDGEGLAWVLTDVTQQELASKARDQYLLKTTRELRDPLDRIKAGSEKLQSIGPDQIETRDECCDTLAVESERVLRLAEQLLSVGSMEAGSLVANRCELDVSQLVNHAIDQLRNMADQKRITVRVETSGSSLSVFGDREKLHAAVVNVIGNAVKYTPVGGAVNVQLCLEHPWLNLFIQDNGPGIDPEETERVFDKFYRGNHSVNREIPGTGLGLAFTREVVRTHGGDVELDTVVGRGSTFKLSLPSSGSVENTRAEEPNDDAFGADTAGLGQSNMSLPVDFPSARNFGTHSEV